MPRFLLFLLILNTLLVLLNVRAYRWLVGAFEPSQRWRRVLLWVLASSLVLSVLSRVSSRAGLDIIPEVVTVSAFAVQLSVIVSVILLLAFDLVRFVLALGRRLLEWRRARSASTKDEVPDATSDRVASEATATLQVALRGAAATRKVSRREFGAQAVVGSTFLIGASSSLYGALWGRHDYVVEEVPVRVPGLSRAFDGFSILQLSDIHIGQFVGEPELAAAIDLVRQAKPDLVVLTGDLIDHDPRFAPSLGRFVRRLEGLAREGVVAISGNHDFYAGIDPIVAALRAGGARVLRNQGLVLGEAGAGVALLGVDDVRASRFHPSGGPDLARAVATLPQLGGRSAPARDLPRVLLCHNPIYFEQAQGLVALQLSGHTHGGQVNLFVRPADWVLPHGWVAGLYEERGSQLYVNRGFGTVGPPARVQAPPELTRVVLTS